MEYTTHASRLRYLDASEVDDTGVDYDRLDVFGADNERIGEVDGFIVDAQAGRLHYIVVDAGGWFSSRRMLIPVGHATVSTDAGSMRLDLTRAALSRYPEYDENRFRELSDDDLRRFEEQETAACCPTEPTVSDYGAQSHYTQPEWWTHFDGRAEPGDLAGTSGERTHLGHTSEGEKRRVAERAIVEEEEERRSQR